MSKGRPTNNRERLAELLRELRAGAGLRQVDLADALGEPQSYVSRYESGEQRLDILEIREVCRVLNISLIDFVKRFEKEVP